MFCEQDKSPEMEFENPVNGEKFAKTCSDDRKEKAFEAE